jgi:20S proteasome alpha/beta subunit
MTTIVATVGNATVTLCADRAISSDIKHQDMSKIVQKGTWLIATCGSARASDVIQHCVDYPEPPEHLLDSPAEQWYGWVASVVVPLIKDALTDADVNDPNSETLLATHGRVFHLDDDLGVLNATPYWAIGTGASFALGMLHDKPHQADWHKNNDLYAIQAMRAALSHDLYTRGQIDTWQSRPTGRITRLQDC